MKTQKKPFNPLNVFNIVTLIFVALKLTGNISWSWWWVLSPLWIDLLLVVAIFGVGGMILLAKD